MPDGKIESNGDGGGSIVNLWNPRLSLFLHQPLFFIQLVGVEPLNQANALSNVLLNLFYIYNVIMQLPWLEQTCNCNLSSRRWIIFQKVVFFKTVFTDNAFFALLNMQLGKLRNAV